MASEVKERLLEYLRYKRISQVDFTRRLGVSSTYIGAMRRSISDDKMRRIRDLYPDLNPDWLLYGEGEMLTGGDDAGRSFEEMLERRGLHEVPLIPASAHAGTLQQYSQGYMAHECERVVTHLHGAEAAIKVYGDSMEPEFHEGSMLFIRKINERSFIPWGHPLVIDTDNGVVLKSIYPVSGSDEEVEARSLNPAYPPFYIPTASIYGIYRILGALTIYSTL